MNCNTKHHKICCLHSFFLYILFTDLEFCWLINWNNWQLWNVVLYYVYYIIKWFSMLFLVDLINLLRKYGVSCLKSIFVVLTQFKNFLGCKNMTTNPLSFNIIIIFCTNHYYNISHVHLSAYWLKTKFKWIILFLSVSSIFL